MAAVAGAHGRSRSLTGAPVVRVAFRPAVPRAQQSSSTQEEHTCFHGRVPDEDSPDLLWALVVPIKPAHDGKTRLAGTANISRRALAHAFALDSVHAMLACPAVGRLIIVGSLPEAPGDPRLEIVEDPGTGLNPAAEAGLSRVPSDDPVAILVADLPALRPEELSRALSAAGSHDRSIICDADGLGTTTYLTRQRRNARPQFGRRSRASHVSAGAVDLKDLVVPGLRCDVDTVIDLWNARRLGVGPHTTGALAGH